MHVHPLTVPLRNGFRILAYMTQMKTVREVCELTGVTRKQLFYYDRIGLLKPTKRTGPQKAKLYNTKTIERLNLILLYQKAGLHLSEIRDILDGVSQIEQILTDAIARLQSEAMQINSQIAFAKEILASVHHK